MGIDDVWWVLMGPEHRCQELTPNFRTSNFLPMIPQHYVHSIFCLFLFRQNTSKSKRDGKHISKVWIGKLNAFNSIFDIIALSYGFHLSRHNIVIAEEIDLREMNLGISRRA